MQAWRHGVSPWKQEREEKRREILCVCICIMTSMFMFTPIEFEQLVVFYNYHAIGISNMAVIRIENW
jgi:hypothetical protein